jgi:glutamate 5-kinase
LTWDDFDDRTRYNNARKTIDALLMAGVVPVINENDTISTEEIKFGDNDKLSALVASMIHADLLVILSDVEGFYDLTSGEKKVFEEIKEITAEIEGLATGTAKKTMSKGGMSAKLEAVKIASHAKVPCIIANGQTPDVLTRILKKERIGTFFIEKEDKLLARKHWISFGAKPKGVIIVDEGAKAALLKGGRSLLLPGVIASEGDFRKEDVVVVCDKDRNELARGIVNYSVRQMDSVTDKKSQPEVIHCDDLVLSKR